MLIFFLPKYDFADELNKVDYRERIVLEDFETLKFTNRSFQVQANTDYLPEVRMSRNLTSPNLQSNTSLLIRIPLVGSGIPMDLVFPTPYRIDEYTIEFEFHIYSNQANGELYLYLQDAKFQKHKFLIANLNFDGWKSFKVPIGNRIAQNDFIIGKPSTIKVTGIQFNLAKKETKDKEDLIVLDDIFVIKRKKYKIPAVKGLEEFQ